MRQQRAPARLLPLSRTSGRAGLTRSSLLASFGALTSLDSVSVLIVRYVTSATMMIRKTGRIVITEVQASFKAVCRAALAEMVLKDVASPAPASADGSMRPSEPLSPARVLT